MKKFFAIAFLAATLVACKGGGESTPAADTTAAAPADTTAAAPADTTAAAPADTTAAAPAPAK